MRLADRYVLLLGVAFLTLSCASAQKLAERSGQELAAGQTDRAYQSALIAYHRDPNDPAVLSALSGAANARADEWKRRVRNLASVDTLNAARQALELANFRREVVSFGVTLHEDLGYARDEQRIRHHAAAVAYAAGDSAMRDGNPKLAYGHFVEARDYAADYRDVSQRASDALRRGIMLIAFLPFADETGGPDMGRTLSEHVRSETLKHLGSAGLTFTSFLTPEQVYDRMTVSELDHLTRENAISLGRRIGARRVVWGRIYSPSVNTNSNRYVETIWRREEFSDSNGTHVRYLDEHFAAVERERHATVRWETEVIDVESEAAVTRREGSEEARARTVWTNFRPRARNDAYLLVPPDMKQRDADRARAVESGWQETFGDWTLPKLLECTRNTSGRTHYSSASRHEFYGDTWSHPVFFDDLPDEFDLIFIALDNVWKPVYANVVDQDPL
jgi:hypothetical protein